jgi:hypothetical protein
MEFTKEEGIESIISKTELLDFVLMLQNAFQKNAEVSKGEVADILGDFKKKFIQEGQNEIIEKVTTWINEDIEIQKDMIKKHIEFKKSADWRIIGMELLRSKLQHTEKNEEKKLD